ncbi:ATP-binding cassette domain-containing protein [Paraburkholderia sp. RL17-373-BIF-A]
MVNGDHPNERRELVVEVHDLLNRFGTQLVHEHLNLDVMRGEILGVVGGSGSGKSVLLRSIIGLREFNAGSIRVFGSNLAELRPDERMRAEERMGILFQRGALFSSLSVLDNVALPLIEHTALARPAAERLARVKLALVGLTPDAVDKAPASLSGGMIKRAALARSIRRSCFSTNRLRGSTRSAHPPSISWSIRCATRSDSRFFWSRTISIRCVRSATASPCCPSSA